MASSSTFGRRGGLKYAPPASRAPQTGRRSPLREPRDATPNSGLGWLLFSYQGRCRRSHYWLGRLGLTGCYFTALFALGLATPHGPADGDLGRLLLRLLTALSTLAVAFGFLWALFAIDVKRCHDRNKTGWFSLVSLVPLLNLWTLIELGILDGAPGENRFGPSPKGIDTTVFS